MQVFDLSGVARAEGWDESELMYFVFEFGTEKGLQYCREFYEMQARQEVGEADLPVFDLVGVAEGEGWDQTELMFFVFEYGVEDGVAFCREYYEMKKSREVRQAVYEPTKETVQFLFRGSAVWGCKRLMVVRHWKGGLQVRRIWLVWMGTSLPWVERF